jgi:ferrochelatase
MTEQAVVLFGHGTVDRLDDLALFVQTIRHGHAASPEFVAELRRRYEAIGGQSPFNAIARELALGVESELGIRATTAMRLWKPTAVDVLRSLASEGVSRAVFVPLAQHSGPVYAEAAARAAAEIGGIIEVRSVLNWGQTPSLLDAYATAVEATLAAVPTELRDRTTTLFTAHSLPKSVIDAGDAYEREFRASVEGVVSRVGGGVRSFVAFQSQGPAIGAGGRPVAWLGPTVEAALDALAARGEKHIVFAPIGFLADHVEVLYDLDVEAREMARARGLGYSRSASLNASPSLVRTIAALARPLLEEPRGS